MDEVIGQILGTPTKTLKVFTDFNDPYSIRTTYPCVTSGKFDNEQRSRIRK